MIQVVWGMVYGIHVIMSTNVWNMENKYEYENGI